MALGVVVVGENRSDVNYGEAALRTVLRPVDVLPVPYVLGFVVVMLTDSRQRLGDTVANTVVVQAG